MSPETVHHQPVPLPALDLPAGAVVVAAVIVVALTLGNAGDTSMVHGWFPVVLFWVTVAVCATPVVHRRHLLHEFASRIPIGIAFADLLLAGTPAPSLGQDSRPVGDPTFTPAVRIERD
jgi:hypothetical protein